MEGELRCAASATALRELAMMLVCWVCMLDASLLHLLSCARLEQYYRLCNSKQEYHFPWKNEETVTYSWLLHIECEQHY